MTHVGTQTNVENQQLVHDHLESTLSVALISEGLRANDLLRNMRVRMGNILSALLYWFSSIGIRVPDTCHPHCLSSSLRAHILKLIVGNQSYFDQAFFCL